MPVDLLHDTVGRKWVQSQLAGAVINGVPGAKGDPGVPGASGPIGAPGYGVISGGVSGQVLEKNSNNNYDMKWGNQIKNSSINGGSATTNFTGIQKLTAGGSNPNYNGILAIDGGNSGSF